MNQRLFSTQKQQGVVLVIVLVMLLILTLIGTAGMRNTALQEKMASNLRENTLSFQAADAALRSGEQEVENRYANNTLSDLESNTITGDNAHFALAKKPEFALHLLANIKTSTEAGVPVDDEGVLVRVDGQGFGQAAENSTPITSTSLQSTYLVEK